MLVVGNHSSHEHRVRNISNRSKWIADSIFVKNPAHLLNNSTILFQISGLVTTQSDFRTSDS